MLVRKSEERYVTTVNASDLGLWDFDIASKKMVAAGKMAEIFGIDSNEQMKLEDIFDCVHPEDKKAQEELYYSIVNKKIDSSFSLEYRIITKNTQEEKWIRAKGKAFFDEDGKPYRTVGTVADITAQKTIEEKIKESEERFRTLAETLPQMVWMLNGEGKIEYGSKNWEAYSGIENVSEAWKAMVHPDDWKTVMNAWEKDSASGKPFRYEVRLKNKEGEYRWHYASGEPVTDKSGHVIKWLGALTDIHVQKTFAEKLEQEVTHRTQELLKANKELDAFNYIASHDLQEPLRKIQTFITLIQKNNEDVSLSQKYFEKVKSSAQRMSELIQSILGYSRLSKSEADCLPTDLNKILSDVKNDFELLIKEKNAVIKSENLPVIKANTLQMHQLFSNLISNALKFSKDAPEITISSKIITGNEITGNGVADAKQKFVQLTFSDNGIGFNPEFKQHIFQLFQRLHSKHEYSGTGIGLSIVKKIVDRHNGYVSADSVPGNGATFNIWLPLS
jgi:PAS domain S-box-containing protein